MKIPGLGFKIPYIILALLLFGSLVLTALLLQFNGLYGQDAHEYLRLSRALNDYIQHSTPVSHSYFPLSYPLLSCLLSSIIRHDIMAMQLVSMLSLSASFFYLSKLLQLVHPGATLLKGYLVAFFFFSPYVFRFALLSMSDMLCLLLVVAATFHGIRYLKAPAIKDAVFFSLFAALAITTRYAVILLLLLPAFYVLKSMVSNGSIKAILFSVAAFFSALLPDWWIRGRILFLGSTDGNLFIDYAPNAYTWSPLHFFRTAFQNPDGSQQYDFPNIFAATFNIIHPAYFFAGAAFIFFLRRNDFAAQEVKLLLFMVLFYGLFIAGLQYQNNRYLLLSFPLVLVILYPAFERIVQRYLFSPKLQVSLLSLVIVVQLTLFLFSFQKILSLHYHEKEIAGSLQHFAGQTIYTCSINGALASYKVDNPVIDLYFTQITQVAPHSLLLFNYAEFSQHFAQQNPMYNWNLLNDQYRLRIIRSFGDGWVLYAIE